MSKPITEPLGRFFLALADAATVDHDKKLPGSRAPVKDNATDADKLAAVSKELRALRNQISAVEAEIIAYKLSLAGEPIGIARCYVAIGGQCCSSPRRTSAC